MGVHKGQDPQEFRIVGRVVDDPDLNAVQVYGQVDNADLDAAMETINVTFDRQEEIAAYQEACTILGDQVVDMPLWMSPGLWTMNARVRNTVSPDGHFNEYVHTWWIAEE